ncbi:MAG: aminomethyl-transferring glycine dehydrogenase subunit GcvPB [Oscillospiraceae bacterium]|nr:aminomethyl-transferring glycine dehydrogenase subunit GcvPB [Oscillospiraceae bacterium]
MRTAGAAPSGICFRAVPPALPALAENEVSRHYAMLARNAFGVNSGFYPLGSCTMKYNPAMCEEAAALPGFADIHPLQAERTVQGCLELLCAAERGLCEITGMDAMSFAPAAGAHGELAGMMMIRAYHESRGEGNRNVIIAPDSAHGTNPASAGMAGFRVVNLQSAPDGGIDIEKLQSMVDENTAGLMLTNPNTLGLFECRAAEAARIVHDAGGLMYYDGANMNAIMGVARPGDMGFDVLHLNLHKTFATPHGGGGPGSGPVACKAALAPFLPAGRALAGGDGFHFEKNNPDSIGRITQFHGNFLVVVRALAYLTALGAEGISEVSENAVLNANYLMKLLEGHFEAAYPGICMHEFVLTLDKLKKQTGVSALDVAKAMIDRGMHPPTMYFPLIVREALMFEPTETETKETLDEAAAALIEICEMAAADPDALHKAPEKTAVSRPDEASAARSLKLRHIFD